MNQETNENASIYPLSHEGQITNMNQYDNNINGQTK